MVESVEDTETETLESLQSKHRKEQRDLVSRITQKKKQASKKTRKGVNDECERLEHELKERQEAEVAALHGEEGYTVLASSEDDDTPDAVQDIDTAIANLDIEDTSKASSANGEAKDTTSDPTTGPSRTKKPNRAKARLARRAAEQSALIADAEREAANAPNPRELERERMAVQLEKHGLALYEIRADGHCLYAAVADQLSTREIGLQPRIAVTVNVNDNIATAPYKKVRYAAAAWIEGHGDEFAGFMEDALPEHVRKIRETGEWGGHLELLALARVYGVRICVLHSDGRVDRIEPEDGEEKELEEIWLGYYKHSHGLGEHYNSLRKAR